jgi:hypothetical protein
VLLLRELIVAGCLDQHRRDIVVEVSDALIEHGAAFLQQYLVREGRLRASALGACVPVDMKSAQCGLSRARRSAG